MQELIGRRKRAGFVGRRGEIDLFRGNFEIPPEDERHSFVFHIHGTAGVGKSSLVRELEAVAEQRKALTARTDETVNSVPEAMAAISAQFARQGTEMKPLDKLVTTYRQRRHEAESASTVLEPGPDPGRPAPPSAGSMAVAQAGLVGLGMVPGVGAFAGAVDPAQVAHGTDRLRAALSARFRNHDDVQLVLEPLKVLTPVFVAELDRVAADIPWITLFFDTYERTAPFLDPWLLDLITTDRYGALPANVIVTLAGQQGPDPTRWADYAGFVTELALQPFTESEARQLLAAKGMVDEDVVQEVLRLSGCLPVLVSTLAEHPGADVGTVDDPAATAVERFLKWERDPARRAAALACALPRQLDEDVFRAAVDDGETEGAYTWLRGLPFVSEQAGRVRYHEVVRSAMLRLQRGRSPRQWAERHMRLAEAFAEWRAGVEEALDQDELWLSESWRELRLEESYHLLCARPGTALGRVLKDVLGACGADLVAARSCAQTLADAGEYTDSEEASSWGHDLLAVLSEESGGVLPALGLLLDRAGFEASVRAEAHALRGRELRRAGEYDGSLTEYGQAIAVDSESAEAYYGRGMTHLRLRDAVAALADLDRADALRPGTAWITYERGEALRAMGRFEESIEVFDRALALDPTYQRAWASRGSSKGSLGDHDGAFADFDRALEIDGEYLWALVHRGRLYYGQGRHDEAFADLDRAVEIAPDSAWIASERGDVYRLAGRNEEAAEELARACALDPDHASAHAGRGYALARLGRHDDARVAFDRAVELLPTYPWALVHRAFLRGGLGDAGGMFADLDLAVSADGAGTWALRQRAVAYGNAGRHLEALADYDLALMREPDLGWVQTFKMAALVSVSRSDEAVAELDRIRELDPDNAAVLANRGLVSLRRSRFREALRDLDQAISLRPDEASLYVTRAKTSIAIGRLRQALADLGQCVERREEVDWANRRTAEVLLWCGRHDEARRLLDELGAATGGGDAETVVMHWYISNVTGPLERARHAGDATLLNNLLNLPLRSAMLLGMSNGLSAAESWWRLARGTNVSEHRAADAADKFVHALAGWALGDWSRADSTATEGLALEHDWEDLADLTFRLTFLARSPDADPALFAPRLARVTAARDAFQARYAATE
ncbi:tetratricopeptide repeat protein [Streptomyces acidicola]|uniref:tetratricopeptide repeat protein n=1 Tax=Streptomyces acidicola TaxID=2596892 RepID=UPI0038037B26